MLLRLYSLNPRNGEYLTYQLAFALNFVLCYSAMKTVGWFCARHSSTDKRYLFFMTPYLSIRSLNYHFREDRNTFIRFMTFLFLTAFMVALTDHFLEPMSFFEILIFSPTIYFFTEAMGGFGQILFYKHITFSIHKNPLSAISLSHFWGRNWNLWVQDWLRDVTEGIGNHKHSKRIIVVFFLSGFFHELMVNLPYWIIYKKSYFGTMMAYFLIQAVALWIDKKVIRHWPRFWKRIYLWTAVILPSPLFINVPLLTFFGISHE